MSTLKFSLSYDDVVRMIGGTGEVAVEVREYIIQQFAKRHLKPLLNDERLARAREAIQKEFDLAVRSAAEEYLHISQQHGQAVFKLTNKVEMQVRSIARDAIEKTVAATVQQLVSADSIKAEIERCVTAAVERRIRDGVAERLNAIMAAAATGVAIKA